MRVDHDLRGAVGIRSTVGSAWRMEFAPSEESVRLVRLQVARALASWGYREDETAAVLLVCSELAANAVRYAQVPGRPFEVRITATGRECLVEVDDVSDAPPRTVVPGPGDERGWGLLLVSALAESFGHRERVPAGKTVWARLLLDGPGATAGAFGR